MIKNTDKLKARFDKYDRLSIIICSVLIAINLLSIFYLKDFIFIGSIIPLILFLIIKKTGGDNKENPIDYIDQFYISANEHFRKYRYYLILSASCLHLIVNYLFYFYNLESVFYTQSFLKGIRVFMLIYVEFLFFGLSAYISNLLFKVIIPYDFRSSIIFYSKDNYLIRIWNFLYYRKEVHNSLKGKKSSFKIWKENRNIIVADRISVLKKEIHDLDDDFLKKMYFYFLYPYDFGGNSEIRMDYLIEKGIKLIGFICPIVLGFVFNGFQTLENVLFIILLCICVYPVWMGLVYLWNWISRKNLLEQIKVILPLLINEELENRKSKRKYKRPHRYK